MSCVLRLELTYTEASRLRLLALLGVRLSILGRAWTGAIAPSEVGI